MYDQINSLRRLLEHHPYTVFAVALVTLIVLGSRNSEEFVWTHFENSMSGWQNDGVIRSVSLLTAEVGVFIILLAWPEPD
jgi:hypothetical protein